MHDDAHILHRWRRTGTRRVYTSPWASLREDTIVFPNGSQSTYSVFELGQCVGVLPLLDDDTVLLVRQYRYIGDAFTWEMPTGSIDAGEAPEAAANRELGEEAGLRAATLQPLGAFHTSKGHCEEIAHLFAGRDLSPVEAKLDETEEIERRRLPFAEALHMVTDGRIVDSMTIIAILRVALERAAARRK